MNRPIDVNDRKHSGMCLEVHDYQSAPVVQPSLGYAGPFSGTSKVHLVEHPGCWTILRGYLSALRY